MAKKPKKASPNHDLELSVVGLRYRLDPEELLRLEKIIDKDGSIPCILEREPDNEVDPLAVKVVLIDPQHKLFNRRHIGYLQRPANETISKVLRRGAQVRLCVLSFVDPKQAIGEIELVLHVSKS